MTQSGTSSSQIFRRSLLDETADAFLRVFRGLQPALSRGYFRPFKHGFSCTGEGRRDRKGSLLANLGCEIDGALALTSRGDHFLNKPQPQGGFGVELLASQEVSQGVGARMPSEWAKRVECWDSLKETRIEPTDPMPQELQSQLKSSGDASEEDVLEPADASVTDWGIDNLILRVRPLFGRSEVLTRGELVNKLSEILGCLSGDGKVAEEVEELIRAAERRSILREERWRIRARVTHDIRLSARGFKGPVHR
jgi:hypothetical protein